MEFECATTDLGWRWQCAGRGYTRSGKYATLLEHPVSCAWDLKLFGLYICISMLFTYKVSHNPWPMVQISRNQLIEQGLWDTLNLPDSAGFSAAKDHVAGARRRVVPPGQQRLKIQAEVCLKYFWYWSCTMHIKHKVKQRNYNFFEVKIIYGYASCFFKSSLKSVLKPYAYMDKLFGVRTKGKKYIAKK